MVSLLSLEESKQSLGALDARQNGLSNTSQLCNPMILIKDNLVSLEQGTKEASAHLLTLNWQGLPGLLWTLRDCGGSVL